MGSDGRGRFDACGDGEKIAKSWARLVVERRLVNEREKLVIVPQSDHPSAGRQEGTTNLIWLPDTVGYLFLPAPGSLSAATAIRVHGHFVKASHKTPHLGGGK